MKQINKILLILIGVMIFIPLQYAHAETMEEQLNNLVGPKKQYGTQMSPVYLKNN